MILGAVVNKLRADGRPKRNRYWINAATVDDTETIASNLVQMEINIFGSSTQFLNVHVWQPGANPNNKRTWPSSAVGLIATSDSLAPEMCLRVSFGTPSTSNPNYKDYRTEVDDGFIVGSRWNSLYATGWSDFGEFWSDQLEGVLCTKDGTPLGGPVFHTRQAFRQLSKAWYNRVII